MRFLIILATVAVGLASPALAAPDGKALFATRCGGCHVLADKSGPAGPQLKGVFGRKIAGASDFNYSPALKGKTGAWSAAGLDGFLTNPGAFAPGSRMFTRLADPAERAAVIAYLKTAK